MSTDRDPGADDRVSALIRELKSAGPSAESKSWAAVYNEHNAEFWKAPGLATAAMFGHHYGYADGTSDLAAMQARAEAAEDDWQAVKADISSLQNAISFLLSVIASGEQLSEDEQQQMRALAQGSK